MITLNSFSYHVSKTEYVDQPDTPSYYGRGQTGKVNIIESGKLYVLQSFTLNVSQVESELLKAAYTLCHITQTNVDYIDETGIFYDTTMGVDSILHKYSTGAWIQDLSDPQSTEELFDQFGQYVGETKRFIVKINLQIPVNEGGYLLTEASEIINTESSDRLLWQVTL